MLLLIIHASKATNCLSHALVQAEFHSRIEIIRLCFISLFLITLVLFFPSPTLSQQKMLRLIICSWQGSAHMGPALTPVEVLVSIHQIVPEKDGITLKKACLLYFKVLPLSFPYVGLLR